MTGDEARSTLELRSYGRRRGRKLSPRQAHLMRDLLPRLAIDLASAPPPSIKDLFRAPDAQWASENASQNSSSQSKAPKEQTWLEIGFGGGEHLVWQAGRNPNVGLIGAEPFEDGIVKVLAAVDEQRLSNVRLHPDDARALLRWLPDASVDRTFILFPDPWPKRRHVKRRLVNADLLAQLARVIRPGGELRLATDIGDYARTMMMAFQSTDAFAWAAASASDWRTRPEDWPSTRYEQKAVREGRKSAYLVFKRRLAD